MEYITSGTCSKKIIIEMDGVTIKSVCFEGGCTGNLTGIASLVANMDAAEVIKKFKGIDCRGKNTSCPDQLAKALEVYLNQ